MSPSGKPRQLEGDPHRTAGFRGIHHSAWGAFIVGAFAALLYLPSARAFFVGDDFDFLLHAQQMTGFSDAVRLAFWGEWNPAWYASWYLDYRIWGLDPLGYHLTNIFWLVVAVVALFAFVRSIWPAAPLAAFTRSSRKQADCEHAVSSLRSLFAIATLISIVPPIRPSIPICFTFSNRSPNWFATQMLSISPLPPSFNLSNGRVRLAAASSAIFSGVSKATVNAVMSAGTAPSPASSATLRKARFASMSQKAQSRALRA